MLALKFCRKVETRELSAIEPGLVAQPMWWSQEKVPAIGQVGALVGPFSRAATLDPPHSAAQASFQNEDWARSISSRAARCSAPNSSATASSGLAGAASPNNARATASLESVSAVRS